MAPISGLSPWTTWQHVARWMRSLGGHLNIGGPRPQFCQPSSKSGPATDCATLRRHNKMFWSTNRYKSLGKVYTEPTWVSDDLSGDGKRRVRQNFCQHIDSSTGHVRSVVKPDYPACIEHESLKPGESESADIENGGKQGWIWAAGRLGATSRGGGGSMLAKLVHIISLKVGDRPDQLSSFIYSVKYTSLGWRCLLGGPVARAPGPHPQIRHWRKT